MAAMHNPPLFCDICAKAKSQYTYTRPFGFWRNPNVTPSTGQVKIWYDTQVDAYRLMMPYHAGLVQFLKDKIPYSDRSYDKSTKIWTFKENWLDAVTLTVKGMFGTAPVIITKAQAQTAQTPPTVTKTKIDVVVLEFVKVVGEESMIKAYRDAMMRHHPDRGGDIAKATKINELWNKMKQELFNNGTKTP
jgi:hypothetical protein